MERPPEVIGFKSDQKPILFFDDVSIPFWLHFWTDLGAFGELFWQQNRPKLRPRCISKPDLLQKRDVHENIVKPMEFQCFLTPRPTPKWTKRSPRRIQEALESLLVLIKIYVPFLLHFGLHFGPSGAPFSISKSLRNRFQNHSKIKVCQHTPRRPP